MNQATSAIRSMLDRQREGALWPIARHHPLASDLLGRPCWNRVLLHRNQKIDWRAVLRARPPPLEIDYEHLSRWAGGWLTGKLLSRSDDVWDWPALSANPGLPWSAGLIKRFASRWDWVALSGNRGVPFTEALLRRFDDRWNASRLAANTSVPWDKRIVRRFADRLGDADPSWHPMMHYERPEVVAPGIRLGPSGWGHLMQNQNPAVAWDEILRLIPAADWSILSANPGLPWSEDFLRRHGRELDWGTLARNPAFVWTSARIDKLIGDGGQQALSLNPGLPWSEELVRRHADRWSWGLLSANPWVSWSVPLLEREAARIDWRKLSASGRLTPEILDRFADKLEWSTAVSCNQSIAWTPEMLSAHADRINWERLSWNPRLPWSEELLLRFLDRWVVRSFERNPAAWDVVAPHVDHAWLRRWS